MRIRVVNILLLLEAGVHAFTLPGMFYPALLSRHLGRSRPVQVTVDDTRLVLFRNASGNAVAHADACPHQGASFAKRGWCERGRIVCGYHGFAFRNGQYGAFQMPLLDTLERDGLLFVRLPREIDFQPEPFAVPESTNPTFKVIRGCRRIAQNHESTSFNVLDNLHLAYVHKAFGNRRHALPLQLSYEQLAPGHGRSTFRYIPRPGSLSTWLGADEVIVQNEFVLPSTTVTRVAFGGYTKTVVTRALPVTENETVLFWELYRDFLNDPMGVFDEAMRVLMEGTLDEDVRMLTEVDARHRAGPLRSRFDTTIDAYRQSLLHHEILSSSSSSEQ
jgi:phenylpropionate dioxygenase-like ring-hydroxylating dioxygenase large terminal subunit